MNFKWISTFAYSFIVSLFFIALWLLVVLASQWHEPGDSVNILEQEWLHITFDSVFLYLFVFVRVLKLFPQWPEPGDSVNILEQGWLHIIRLIVFFLYLFVHVQMCMCWDFFRAWWQCECFGLQRWLHRLQRRKIWGKQNEPHCP